MKESFLHFIWQFQQFDKSKLRTTDGELVEIFAIGNHNTDAGPDFKNAKIKIGKIIWHGQIEIHTSSSCWKLHGHQDDRAYDNVVLHVVWENDEHIFNKESKLIPTVELKDKIPSNLLAKCHELINSTGLIPCSSQIHHANKMNVLSMQQQATIERLKMKSKVVTELLRKNNMDWEETAYQLLAKNFGFKINSDSFLRMAQNVPLKYLKKHTGSLIQIEAILFGVAGFLNQSPLDDYHSILMNEYAFLAKKYSLEGNEIHASLWKHLRLRPGNFPAVRISQFAALINKNPHLFDGLTNIQDVKSYKKALRIKPSDYWKRHYQFGKETKKDMKGMGLNSVENLLINTSVPLLVAYSHHLDEPKHLDQALTVLENLRPESNHITRRWKELGISSINAFESQALIEMYNNYCLKKRCLSCKIGVGLISSK